MPVGSIKIISRKICKPPCCSNLQTNNSGSLESKTSSESNCTLQEANCSLKETESWIADNLQSSSGLEFEILAIPSNSYYVNKTLISIDKLDCCFKKYQLNLKLYFINKFFNMDYLTKELHKEASIRVITKCVESLFKNNFKWALEMLKWNINQQQVLEEFFNESEVCNSLDCVKFIDNSTNDINHIDEINSDNNVLSTISSNEYVENEKLDVKDFRPTDIYQRNDEYSFKMDQERDRGVFMIHSIISNIIFKKKSQVWWKLVINYCECQLKEMRLELLRNAKIKIKRGKFQIAMNLVKSNMSLVETKLKQWAFYNIKSVLNIDNSFNRCINNTIQNSFPSGIIGNIPFLNQTPFLDLAIKSSIHK